MKPATILRRQIPAVLAAFFGFFLAWPDQILADDTPHEYPSGSVDAQSRFGNGSISGIVRPTDLGWQVQLPGGRWVYCRRNCAETLRVETIDFFETNGVFGSGQLGNECGIFGCLDLNYPR